MINEFKVSGEIHSFYKAVYDLESLKLQKGDNNFKVTFACINFSNADKIAYRYRLKGAENEWTQTDYRNRCMNYTNLKPGNYMLEIEATNPDGEWASHTSLNIDILFRFYETFWFWLLIIFLSVGFLLLLVLLYVRQIKLNARQKLDELTMESIRGQMKPHFIFNSLISINYFIMKNDRLSANHYIADFARLIRSIISNMAEDFVQLDSELQSIRDYLRLEHLRFGDKFTYSVDCNFNDIEKELWIMPGLVHPFIENDIWHWVRNLESRIGYIRVSFVFAEEQVCVKAIVEDTGVGRKLAAQMNNELPGKKSRGIAIINERLMLVNKMRRTSCHIRIENLYPEETESGTRVEVDIPVRI